MQNTLRSQKQDDDRIVFLQEFLKHPRQVASIIPSSRFLQRRIIKLSGIRSARMVVELGGGTGGTTRAILRELPASAKLLVIEINPQFCALLRRIQDGRLIVHPGGAQELAEAIAAYGLPAPDTIVSGIPFSTMSAGAGARTLAAISSVLAPGGRFLAYQVSKQVDELASPLLGPARVELELFNVPPMRLFGWVKQACRAEPA